MVGVTSKQEVILDEKFEKKHRSHDRSKLLVAEPQHTSKAKRARGRYARVKQNGADHEPSGGSEKELRGKREDYIENMKNFREQMPKLDVTFVRDRPEVYTWDDEETVEQRDKRQKNRAGRTFAVKLEHKGSQALATGQSVGTPPKSPTMVPDIELRRAVYKARKSVKVARADEVHKFQQECKRKFEPKFEKLVKERVQLMEINYRDRVVAQSWNPKLKSAGVFKAYVNGVYVCTATLISGKMWMVVHAMSEDITAKYLFVNHQHSLEFTGKHIHLVNDVTTELAYFDVSGIPCAYKVNHLKIPTESAIVSVFGYGTTPTDQPDVVPGFASPLGWCNSKTRNGDCSSPVITDDGNIIGLWTHGNGQTFGCFEPVSQSFIDLHKNVELNHIGLDFRSNPLQFKSY
jgi:hypothetical protein